MAVSVKVIQKCAYAVLLEIMACSAGRVAFPVCSNEVCLEYCGSGLACFYSEFC